MPAAARSVELATIAARAAADKLAHDLVVLDVSEQLVITDVFVIASAPSERQVGAIVDEAELRLRQAGVRPARREGERGGRWVLLDFVDIVVHVMHEQERLYYALERLWKDCPAIPYADGLATTGIEGKHAAPGGHAAPGDAAAPRTVAHS